MGEKMKLPGNLVSYRDLILRLVRREVVNRTSGTVLGGVWLFAQPAMQVAAFYFLLDVVLQVRTPGKITFVNYFLTAMVPWLLMSEVLSRSLNVLSEFCGLYQRTLFPIQVLPLLPLVMAGIIYGPVYMVVAGALTDPYGAVKAAFFVFALTIWLLPFCYLLAVIGLFFKETRQVFPFLLTMLMYFSPILYQPDVLSADLRAWMEWNPVAGLIAIAQHLMHDLPLETLNILVPWVIWGIALVPAWIIFQRAEPYMREEL